MAGRFQDSRNAVLLVATTFVLSSGIVVCFFIVMVFGDNTNSSLLSVLGLFLSVTFILWSMRRSPEDAKQQHGVLRFVVSLFRQRPARVSPKKYRPIRKKYLQIEDYGEKQPPTSESIRQQFNHLNTFVPDHKRQTQAIQPAAEPPQEQGTARRSSDPESLEE